MGTCAATVVAEAGESCSSPEGMMGVGGSHTSCRGCTIRRVCVSVCASVCVGVSASSLLTLSFKTASYTQTHMQHTVMTYADFPQGHAQNG